MFSHEHQAGGQPADLIEADQRLEFDDEGYAESMNTSYVSSIASEIRKGIEENGRIYPAFGKNAYGLPVDDGEQERNDIQHAKFHLILGNRLHRAPISEEPANILDLGTGSGIWAIDMADMYATAEVTGVDIAPCQPSWVPPNCVFEIDDVESQWLYKPDYFDFIHCREMLLSIRDWSNLVNQSFNHLKPGGWLELSGTVPEAGSDDGTVPKDSPWRQFTEVFQEISEKIGASVMEPKSWKAKLEAAGFGDVQEEVFKIPSSPWPKDKRLKRIGAFEAANFDSGADALLIRGMTQVLGRSREEAQILAAAARNDARNHRLHGYIYFYVVYGRKPEGHMP